MEDIKMDSKVSILTVFAEKKVSLTRKTFLMKLVNLLGNISLINPGDLGFLRERTAFAQASYCLEGLNEWKCVKCSQSLQVRDIKFAGEFDSTVFAYTGYSVNLKSIVISFRGTRTLNGSGLD
jgi:hypothetical protein